MLPSPAKSTFRLPPGVPLATGFVAIAVVAAVVCGLFPVGLSIAAVFLFAGPHNWFEARYILGRLPARTGKLWAFFLVSFVGIVGLTAWFAALPWLFHAPRSAWITPPREPCTSPSPCCTSWPKCRSSSGCSDVQPLHVFLVYYLFTVTVEMAVLLVLLSRRHSLGRKLLAGVWLTACTYPVVWYVIPSALDPVEERLWYLVVAETFAPAAECLIFWVAFVRRLPPAGGETVRDMAAIVLANLASFGVGELLSYSGVRLV